MANITSECTSKSDKWCVAVFAARESPDVLRATLSAVQFAAHVPTTVDVLVNGNRDLTEGAKNIIVSLQAVNSLATFRLWYIALGDKAHTWNSYLHHIWPGDGRAYFVDGYARPNSDAFMRIDQALSSNKKALLASGVPTCGRSAEKARAEQIKVHGIHGNLFSIRAETMQSLRIVKFYLPLGIYRTDSTIGAVMQYSLDPLLNKWDPDRIFVESKASWGLDEKRWWRYSDLKGQLKRLVRQAQGDLENRAVRHHLSIHRRAPQDMPRTIRQLIEIWMRENPSEAASLLRNPLRRHALKQIQKPRDWTLASLPPEVINVTVVK